VPARDRASVSGQPSAPGTPSARAARARRPPTPTAATARRTAAAAVTERSGRPAARADVVVGDVPALARAAGALLVLAGLLGAVAVFPTYLVVGGDAVDLVAGPLEALVALVAPVAGIAVGAGLAAGRVPRLGLAYTAVTGALAVGRLLIELYQGHGSTARPAVEVLAGERVVTSSVDTGPGWVLGVAALAVTVLAGVVALMAWNRTLMEDGGSLDPVRPALAALATFVGVAAVLCLALPAADVPDQVVTDPATGLETVVTVEGPQALLERPGLALLGGLLLAGALLLCSVVAPSLRPRLGAVGGLLALTVALLATALAGARDAARGAEVDWTVPGMGLLVLALASAGVTALAWRWRAGPAEVPAER
jgi:hypothetical protein